MTGPRFFRQTSAFRRWAGVAGACALIALGAAQLGLAGSRADPLERAHVDRPEPARADLSPVGLDLVGPLMKDGRWVWLGDSFAVPTPLRVPFAALRTWPLDRVAAVATGSQSTLTRLVPAGPAARVVWDENNYVLASGTSLESTLGLPLFRLLEWNLPQGTRSLGSIDLQVPLLTDGNAGAEGRVFDGGATVRPLLYAQPGATARGTLRLAGSDAASTPLPTSGFALGAPTSVDDDGGTVSVSATLTAPGFVHMAGTVLAGAPGPGHYAQFLADRSWSYWGFGSDADPAPPDSVKRFRTADLAGYLAATTLDPDQPSVAAIYLAQERASVEDQRDVFQRVVGQTRDAFAAAGLAPPVILLVHPHAIQNLSITTAEENERSGIAMREVALANPDVAFVSIYDATDGVLFDGSAEARAWLADNGWAELSFGTHRAGADGPIRLLSRYGANLLTGGLHPDEEGALFFSAVLGDVLARGIVATEPGPSPTVVPLAPNPARVRARVTGARPGAPIYDVRGRLVGHARADGSFDAPHAAGVYLVGRARLVVQ
ncbi:hypothetical protein [Rubrivirga sp.]|uniref:hypothetical protein n=1 Tax=Rubrivirga sp. TaxID=1885344 RepID=UPI003B5201AD